MLILAVPSRGLAGDPALTIEDWHYIQQMAAAGEVNSAIWKVVQDGGWTNPKLLSYARDMTRANAATARTWYPPSNDLVPTHEFFVDVLERSARYYSALADGNLGIAQDEGKKLAAEFERFQAEWARIADRFDSEKKK